MVAVARQSNPRSGAGPRPAARLRAGAGAGAGTEAVAGISVSPRIRDNRAFWIVFLTAIVASFAAAGLAYVAFGVSYAAFLLLAEIFGALLAGLR